MKLPNVDALKESSGKVMQNTKHLMDVSGFVGGARSSFATQ